MLAIALAQVLNVRVYASPTNNTSASLTAANASLTLSGTHWPASRSSVLRTAGYVLQGLGSIYAEAPPSSTAAHKPPVDPISGHAGIHDASDEPGPPSSVSGWHRSNSALAVSQVPVNSTSAAERLHDDEQTTASGKDSTSHTGTYNSSTKMATPSPQPTAFSKNQSQEPITLVEFSNPAVYSKFTVFNGNNTSLAGLGSYTTYATGGKKHIDCFKSQYSWLLASTAWWQQQVHGLSSFSTLTTTQVVTQMMIDATWPTTKSVYTLCDGYPRVDDSPTFLSSVSSLTGTYRQTVPLNTFTLLEPSCTLDLAACYWLYTETNIRNDTMGYYWLVRTCGWITDFGACVVKGGPIRYALERSLNE